MYSKLPKKSVRLVLLTQVITGKSVFHVFRITYPKDSHAKCSSTILCLTKSPNVSNKFAMYVISWYSSGNGTRVSFLASVESLRRLGSSVMISLRAAIHRGVSSVSLNSSKAATWFAALEWRSCLSAAEADISITKKVPSVARAVSHSGVIADWLRAVGSDT